MKTVLVIDGAGHDLEALQKLLLDHGYAACEMSESALQMEEALQQSEKRFRSIFESAPIGMFRSSLDGKLLGVNPVSARMLRYDSPEEMLEAVNRTGVAEPLYPEPGHPSASYPILLPPWHSVPAQNSQSLRRPGISSADNLRLGWQFIPKSENLGCSGFISVLTPMSGQRMKKGFARKRGRRSSK
jgi:hypothetical protein